MLLRAVLWSHLAAPPTDRPARLAQQADGLDDRQNLRATLFGESDSEEEAEPSGSAGKDALARLAARKRQERQEAVRLVSRRCTTVHYEQCAERLEQPLTGPLPRCTTASSFSGPASSSKQ